jgi:nucleotide-binding universal stress UspA family protein
LVTVSEQQSALYAVRFVGQFFCDKRGLNLTLFYTAPRPPAVWQGERTLESVAEAEAHGKRAEGQGHQALETARKELIMMGCRLERINTKLQRRRFSKVGDIVQEMEKGLYDAVALGRRGLSWLEEAFEESVTKGMLEKRVTFPVWACRRPEPDLRHVLLCVDGSEAAYRMAEHVGFMLGSDADQEVVVATVCKSGRHPSDEADKVLAKAIGFMRKAGYPPEKARTKVLKAASPAKAILGEADKGKYAVVAMGRTGKGHGLMDRLFMGSVSMTVFREMDKGAVWICH